MHAHTGIGTAPSVSPSEPLYSMVVAMNCAGICRELLSQHSGTPGSGSRLLVRCAPLIQRDICWLPPRARRHALTTWSTPVSAFRRHLCEAARAWHVRNTASAAAARSLSSSMRPLSRTLSVYDTSGGVGGGCQWPLFCRATSRCLRARHSTFTAKAWSGILLIGKGHCGLQLCRMDLRAHTINKCQVPYVRCKCKMNIHIVQSSSHILQMDKTTYSLVCY